MNLAIETQNLTRRYGRVEAVRGLNLQVRAGQITGFLGRNGAGKSTTIKMLLGMTTPTAGDATVLGLAVGSPRQSRDIRRKVAWVGEDKHLYGYMTVAEIIRFTASFYPDWRPDTEHRMQGEYRLPSEQKVGKLSKGMRTKLALLLALSRRPGLLILDEPSEGLDPVSIEDLLQTLVTAAHDGTTVFFSSHQISEVERIADRVCMIDRGRLLADLGVDEIRQDYRRIAMAFPAAPHESDFELPGVWRIEADGRQLIACVRGNADGMIERGRSLGAISVEVTPLTLRELFLEMVGSHDDVAV